jgi:hypothetical protein
MVELESDRGLGLEAVFYLLEKLNLPGVCIVEVGGRHDIEDWGKWSSTHQPLRDDDDDILLVPLLRRGHWYLLHLDRRKQTSFVYHFDVRVQDAQLTTINEAIITTYTNMAPHTWKGPVDTKVIRIDHA